MTDRYARLNLYFGLTDSRGLTEGRFDLGGTDNYSKGRKLRAFEFVNDAISAAVSGQAYPQLVYGTTYFVNDEQQARALEISLKNKFEGIESSLETELCDCIHGALRFTRSLLFRGIGSERRVELIGKIKETGIGIASWISQASLRREREIWSQYLSFHD